MITENIIAKGNAKSYKKVNVIISKFEPLLNDHIKEAKKMLKENHLPTVLVVVSDNYTTFSDVLRKGHVAETLQKYSFLESVCEISEGTVENVLNAIRPKYEPIIISTDIKDSSIKESISDEMDLEGDVDVRELALEDMSDIFANTNMKNITKHMPACVHQYIDTFKSELEKMPDFVSVTEGRELKGAEKLLKKEIETQGFEIFPDDSYDYPVVTISVDELIKNGSEYKDIQKAIDKTLKKFKTLEIDTNFSNDGVVSLKEKGANEALDKSKMNMMNGLSIIKSLKSNVTDIVKELTDKGIDSEDIEEFLIMCIKSTTQSNESTNLSYLHEKATSKAQRRLFAIALQYKKGYITKEELDTDYAAEIIKLSNLPTETLEKFAKTKESKLPQHVDEAGEPFSFSIEPLTFPNFMHGIKTTNIMAKQELTTWWSSLGLTREQQELAYNNMMKVMHGMYTNYYLGHPGRALIGNNDYAPEMSDVNILGKIQM